MSLGVLARRSSLIAGGGLLATLTLAACGSAVPPPTATTPQISTSISVASEPPATSSAAGSATVSSAGSNSDQVPASTATAAPVGSAQTLTGSGEAGTVTLTVTVHGYAPFTSDNQFDQPNAGNQTVAVDAEVCSSVANKVSADDRWVLVDANNGRYEPEAMLAGAPTPEYPYFPTDIAAGECIRGYIPFEVRADVPITIVRYATERGGYTLRWSV